MSFRYEVLNLEALVAEPLAIKNAVLPTEAREILDKTMALKNQILDWAASEQFTAIQVRGVEFKLVKV